MRALQHLLPLWLLLALFLTTPNLLFAWENNTWSDTQPAINLVHIFKGEINRKGKATGFHHLDVRTGNKQSRLKKILSGPNKAGIYTAIIEIWSQKQQIWKEKFSSMFPDRMKRPEVIQAILKAYKGNILKSDRKWRGRSGYGFMIEGYLLKDGRIITAYPLYAEDP